MAGCNCVFARSAEIVKHFEQALVLQLYLFQRRGKGKIPGLKARYICLISGA